MEKKRQPRRIGMIDMLIYRLFYVVWSPILRSRPDLVRLMAAHMRSWLERESGTGPAPKPVAPRKACEE